MYESEEGSAMPMGHGRRQGADADRVRPGARNDPRVRDPSFDVTASGEPAQVARLMQAPSALPQAPRWTAPADAAFSLTVEPNDMLLFRCCALTFNGHRIHNDRKYATEVEGYPGVVVHGPLIVTLLLDLLSRQQPDAVVKPFTFKALRATLDLNAFNVCSRPNGPAASSCGHAPTKAGSRCGPQQRPMNSHTYKDIRDATRALRAEFPDAHHRQIDAARGYPEAILDALT
jgi:hypothetical protein